MKKILIIALSLTIITTCYAQDEFSADNQSKLNEINLNTENTTKTYNLTKPNCNNKTDKYYHEENDDNEEVLPFKFMQTPLNMLKQYQQQ